MDKIIESNKQTINDRNNKIKALKESYETKIQQHQKKYNKKTQELQDAVAKMQEIQSTMEADQKKDVAAAVGDAKKKYERKLRSYASR